MLSVFARGWRQFRFDWRRYVSAAIALVFGVALFLGTASASSSLAKAISDRVGGLSGIGNVAAVPDVLGASISANDLASISKLPSVGQVIPTLSRLTTVRSGSGDQDLTVTGYPTTWNSSLHALVVTGHLPQPDSLEAALPKDIADRLHVNVGEDIDIASSSGRTRLRVAGIVDQGKIGLLAYNTIFVDVSTAQKLFAMPAQYTRVDLRVDSVGSVQNWLLAHGTQLPAGIHFQDSTAATTSFGPLISAISLILGFASLVTLFVGVMLVSAAYDSITNSRRSSYGAMRAFGATGRWLALGLLVEAVVIGLACAVVGIGLGMVISYLLVQALVSGGTLPSASVSIEWWQIAAALGVAVLASMFGVLRALRAVLRQPPVFSLNDETPHTRRLNRVLAAVGAVAILAGVIACLMDGVSFAIGGTISLLIGAAVCAPALLPGMARILAGFRTWTAKVSMNRVRRLSMLGPTTSLTAVIICLSVALTGATAAIGSAMREQIGRQFGADVQVALATAGKSTLTSRIASVPGVKVVAPVLSGTALLSGPPGSVSVGILAVDPKSYFKTAGLPWVDGDDASTPTAFQQGGGAIVPAGVAEARSIKPGDHIVLSRDGSAVNLTVRGTFASLSTGNQIIIGQQSAAHLGLTGVTGWNVLASGSATAKVLQSRISSNLSDLPGVTVITSTQMRERAESELGTYTGAIGAVVFIALLLGSIGAAGVFSLGVQRRQRELGTLRALGASPGEIRGLVIWDAVAAGITAAIVGAVLGLVATVLLTKIVAGALGVVLPSVIEPIGIVVVVAVAITSLVVSASGPSRRAGRVSPVVALSDL